MSLQPKDLRYTISTDYGETVLSLAPKGWDEGLIKWIRSEKYWGMFRSFSIPMQFAKDGKAILAEVYAKQGSEGRASVLIERLDRSTWTYKTYYNGVVDFSTIKWGHDFIECNLLDGGISQLIKANETTKYDINKAPYNAGLAWQSLAELPETTQGPGNTTYDFVTLRSAIEALLYQMAGAVVPFYSPLLDALDADDAPLFITNGRALRNSYANAVNFVTTIHDLFQFLNSQFCCGMGVEVIDGVDTVVIAEREYFLSDTAICSTVPNTREVEISPAKQFIANTIKYGPPAWEGLTYPFSTWDQNQVNAINKGRFQAPAVGNIPVRSAKGEIDASTSYYLEGRFIEFIPQYNAGVLDTDESYDNDIFCAHAQYLPTPGCYPYSFYPGFMTGVLRPFNTYISPKRSLERWRKYIDSVTFGIVNVIPFPVTVAVVLPEGAANTQVTIHSDYSNDDSVEPSDMNIDNTYQIFKPYIFKIKTSGTVDLADVFEANHNGYISFVYRGVTLKGHIMEVSANPSRRKELEFTLLAHKDTNLEDIL